MSDKKQKAIDPRFAQQFSDDDGDNSQDNSNNQNENSNDNDSDMQKDDDISENNDNNESELLSEQNDNERQLLQQQLQQNDRGICYLPRIPPFMNPNSLRRLLTQRFKVERIYLEAEADHITRQRRKTGGNHKVKYVEGWVEFTKKQEAKLAALALNGTQIGGKKRHNLFYDDIWTIKYLPKFKWQNLTEKLAYDQKVREQRLKAQNSQAKKEIGFYMDKVDLKKKLDKMEEKKHKKMQQLQQHDSENEDNEINNNDNLPHEKKKQKNLMKIMNYNQRKRREFKQRIPVTE